MEQQNWKTVRFAQVVKALPATPLRMVLLRQAECQFCTSWEFCAYVVVTGTGKAPPALIPLCTDCLADLPASPEQARREGSFVIEGRDEG